MQMEIKRKEEQYYLYQVKQTLETITRDKEVILHNDQGTIQEEDITIINIGAPNINKANVNNY